MQVIGAGATMAGSILGAYGSLDEGQAKSNMYNYQASVAKINEDIAHQNAKYAKDVGEVEAQRMGMKGRFEVGATKATQGGRGLDVNTGSAALTRDSMEMVSAHEQDLIRSNALKKAYGYEVEATSQKAQGQLYRMSAADAQRAGQLGFYTSILGGASAATRQFMSGSQAGMFS